jgi:hypothetical protein
VSVVDSHTHIRMAALVEVMAVDMVAYQEVDLEDMVQVVAASIQAMVAMTEVVPQVEDNSL